MSEENKKTTVVPTPTPTAGVAINEGIKGPIEPTPDPTLGAILEKSDKK